MKLSLDLLEGETIERGKKFELNRQTSTICNFFSFHSPEKLENSSALLSDGKFYFGLITVYLLYS